MISDKSVSLLQVISTELNRAVLELLQQLLFWQERAKSASPYNLAKRKRLVSGLRCAPLLDTLHSCAVQLGLLCLGRNASFLRMRHACCDIVVSPPSATYTRV